MTTWFLERKSGGGVIPNMLQIKMFAYLKMFGIIKV